MKRSDFLKNLLGLFSLSIMPVKALDEEFKVYVLQSFVSGFKYYKGIKMLSSMKSGAMLELVREHQNEYDSNAIALYYKNEKIGYVPKNKNETLSQMIDAGFVKPGAIITHVEENAAPWEQVHFAVYLNKKSGNKLSNRLTKIKNPEYKSLISTGDDFYKALVENSSNDTIYSILHNSFSNGYDLNRAVLEERILVRSSLLPKVGGLKVSDLPVELHDNYYVANLNRLAKIASQIQEFRPLKDYSGKLFYEVVFK